MRLWSLHPRYLDRQGLLACWREGLLAQKVLAGGTRGYTNHPQLIRFQAQPDPGAAIGQFLRGLASEAAARGYRFDVARITCDGQCPAIEVASGQLVYEQAHLRAKLVRRSPDWLAGWPVEDAPTAHPVFRVVPGPVAEWEAVIPAVGSDGAAPGTRATSPRR